MAPSQTGRGTNMILDHVSASWAEDEILSVANNNTNVTVQYSMINDALVSNHAYGSLIRPRIDSNVTFHHNLYANNASRQARFGTYDWPKRSRPISATMSFTTGATGPATPAAAARPSRNSPTSITSAIT